MSNWLSKGSDHGGFEELQRLFLGMLEDGAKIFAAATGALMGDKDPETVRTSLFKIDDRINYAEQEMRRRIVIHGTVHGVSSFPSLLVLMSLGKDAERIGDYAKNIFDLAVARPDLGDQGEREELAQMRERVQGLLVSAREIYQGEDQRGARDFLLQVDKVQDTCDAALEGKLRTEGRNCAGQVLAYRYLKRVASHIGNVVTSLVMPLDKLDFFDEP